MAGPYTPFGWYTPQQPTDPDMLRKAMADLVDRKAAPPQASQPYEPFGWYKEPTTPGYFGNQVSGAPAAIPPGLNRELAQSPITPLPRMMPGGLTEQEAANEALAKKAAIEKLAQDRGIDRQQALVGIGESLGNMEITTPGSIMYGQKQQPFLADAARAKLERMQDEMTEGDRKAFSAILSEALGKQLEIPRGMSWTRAKQFFPAFSNLALGQARYSSPQAQERLDLQRMAEQRREEQGNKRIALTERGQNISQESLNLRKKAWERPDSASLRKLEEYDPMIMATLQIRDEYQNNPNIRDSVGPVAGRWNNILNRLGIADPEWSTFSANVESVIANNLYALSGKQINEAERADLRRTVFETMQNSESFEALLDNFLNRLNQRREAVLRIQEAVGRDVSGLRGIDPMAAPPPAATTPGSTAQSTTPYQWKLKPPTGGPLHPAPEQGLKWMVSPKGVKRQVTLEEAKTLSELGWSEGTP